MYMRRNTLNSNRLLNIRAMFYGEGKKKVPHVSRDGMTILMGKNTQL